MATLDEKVDGIQSDVSEIKQVLKGYNGQEGLVKRVETVCDEHNKLSRNFWILVAFLIGSGIISGTIIGVFA